MFAYCNNNPVMGYDPTGAYSFGIPLISHLLDEIARKILLIAEQLIDNLRDAAVYKANTYLSETQMQRNATIVYNYLSKQGWSHNAICAVLGNMQQESTINPGFHQRGGGAFGIVQWDPATKYTDWADQNRYAHDSITGQLKFLIYSMQPGKGEWFKSSKYPDYYLSAASFIGSDASIEFLTCVFTYSYERPGKPMLENRIAYAKYWSEYFTIGG